MRCEVVGCPEEATFTIARRGNQVIVVLDPGNAAGVTQLCDGHYHRLREWGLDLPTHAPADEQRGSRPATK